MVTKVGVSNKPVQCGFLQHDVDYLGHVVNSKGLHAPPSNVEAVVNAPIPQDVTQLRAFLGLLNYCSEFLRNQSGMLHPLDNLLRKDQPWEWTTACDAAFVQTMKALVSFSVLVISAL